MVLLETFRESEKARLYWYRKDTWGGFIVWPNMHYALIHHRLDREKISLLTTKEKKNAPQTVGFYDHLGSGQWEELLVENEGHPSQAFKRNGLSRQL